MGKRYGKKQWDEEDRIRNRKGSEGGQEELTEYIRVVSPGTFVVILSLMILLVSTIVWGCIGTLPVTETVTGVVIDTDQYDMARLQQGLQWDGEDKLLVLCFVDASSYNAQAIKEFGNRVSLKMPDQKTFSGTIASMFPAPISREEAKSVLFGNEWVLEKCAGQDYNWLLAIRPEEDLSRYTFTLTEVTFLTDEVAPISFLMR